MTRYRYKFTNADNTTYDGFKWEPGKWYETSGEGALYRDGWLHCYSDPLLAVLHVPFYSDYYRHDDKLWLVEVSGETLDERGMTEGWTRMRLVEEIEKPQVTLDQRTAYGIICALSVCNDMGWIRWAHDWLSGADRTGETSRAAAYAIDAHDDNTGAYYAADAAANVYDATHADDNAANNMYHTSYFAYYATEVTKASFFTSLAAVRTGKPINLSHLATQALFY